MTFQKRRSQGNKKKFSEMTYQVYSPTDITKKQLSLFKENDIPKTQVANIHMYYVSQIFTKKQELIAVEFSELIAFSFVGGKPNIKMV